MVGIMIVLDSYISESGRIQIENINKKVKQHLLSEYYRIFQIELDTESLNDVIDDMKGADWKSFSKYIERPIVVVSNIPRWNKAYKSRNPNSEKLWIPFSDFTANSSDNLSYEIIIRLERYINNTINNSDNISSELIIKELKIWLEQHINNTENNSDSISSELIITELKIWFEHHVNNKPNSRNSKSVLSKNKSLIDIDLSESYLIGSKFDGVDMFHSCLKGATLTNASFKSTNLNKANLNKASMNEAILSKASLSSATLAEAKLMEVNLNKANLNGAYLTNADLSGANISGADFLDAHLEGTKFIFAKMDGKTRFQKWDAATTISEKINIDERTDFTGAHLDSIALTPEVRGKLEKNIRKLRWNKWYEEKSKWIKPSRDDEADTEKTTWYQAKQNIKLCLNYILTFLLFICCLIMTFATHLFWVLSDYGTSTKRVLGFFVSWNILFATIYSICMVHFPNVFADANSVFSHALQMDEISIIQTLIQITQTLIQSNFVAFNPSLLGIGSSFWWTILSFLHVIGCYFILAALLTRVAIMFQKQSP